MNMTQTYVFEVTVEYSNDEFSEGFNPMDEDAVRTFEESLEEILRDNHWDSTFSLKRVIVDL
jgi:hypothetical protein